APAQGQGLRRLEPEQPREDDGRPLLAAGREPPVRLHAHHLGRAGVVRGGRRPRVLPGRRPRPRREARRPPGTAAGRGPSAASLTAVPAPRPTPRPGFCAPYVFEPALSE